jgi:hypothetical protein
LLLDNEAGGAAELALVREIPEKPYGSGAHENQPKTPDNFLVTEV